MNQKTTPVALEERITKHTAHVVIVGMGYVGLPLAVGFARAGLRVTGLDIAQERVDHINAGVSDIADISNDELRPLVKSGKLAATTDVGVIAQADCVSICVPTPLSKTKDPDVSFILKAVEGIKDHLHRGMLVVLESTTYPGTTEELIRPMLEGTGLKVGEDFYLAFSPERVDPGNPVYQTQNTPRIVGGTTPECARIARLFYEQAIEKVLIVSSTQAAEMVKLLENTFRSVNIGLVNEVALMCDRLNIGVWEIIDAAASKPFGFMPFYPGPGLGGHCIPIDPHYLSWKLKSLNYYARFIELAGDINSHMPEYVVERVGRALNTVRKAVAGAKILALGVAYKKDISDVRESPALDVIRLLQQLGAQVEYTDPYVAKIKTDNGSMTSVELTPERLQGCDCAVVLTDHTAFDYELICRHAPLIMDTRNATRNIHAPAGRVVKL
jgi:UDP-N-acetyl-D-glucosamine dehydrogenase